MYVSAFERFMLNVQPCARIPLHLVANEGHIPLVGLN